MVSLVVVHLRKELYTQKIKYLGAIGEHQQETEKLEKDEKWIHEHRYLHWIGAVPIDVGQPGAFAAYALHGEQ